MSTEEFESLRDDLGRSLQERTGRLAGSLIENLQPNVEQLNQLKDELNTEAKVYFLAQKDGNQSPVIKMIAELFQGLIDKINIALGANSQ